MAEIVESHAALRPETAEIEELRARLQEAEEMLRAIRSGEVDALVVDGSQGPRLYTLMGADHPYRRMVEQMGDGAVTLTQSGTILYCNRCFAEILRMPLEKVIGAAISDFMTQESAGSFAALLETVREQVGRAELTLLVAKHDSESPPIVVPVEVSASKIDLDGDSVVCLIVRDLTEQRRQQETLESNRRKLADEQLKANKLESLGILAGGLAHDLNNALTAALGNIALARKRSGDRARLEKGLADAEAACFQARDVTQQLLTFGRGGLPIKRVTNLGPLLPGWTNFAVSGSNVSCDFQIAPDLWPVEIDEGQIGRVINNLVINAQQAMPEGGVIFVAAENVLLDEQGANGLPLPAGRYVRITVRDSGMGIPEGHLQKVFDPYFTTKQSGSGLGLSIAYSVIKAHDGYITAESQLGAGTSFLIYLLASTRDVGSAEAAPPITAPGGLRIMVMDDQEPIRRLIRRAVEDADVGSVEYAANGAQAIALYGQAVREGTPFDVVLMDLTIPGGMGGKEAIARLREIDPQVRAIVFSGYSDDPIMAEYEKHGFSGVLPKPFNIDTLLNMLTSVARRQD